MTESVSAFVPSPLSAHQRRRLRGHIHVRRGLPSMPIRQGPLDRADCSEARRVPTACDAMATLPALLRYKLRDDMQCWDTHPPHLLQQQDKRTLSLADDGTGTNGTALYKYWRPCVLRSAASAMWRLRSVVPTQPAQTNGLHRAATKSFIMRCGWRVPPWLPTLPVHLACGHGNRAVHTET